MSSASNITIACCATSAATPSACVASPAHHYEPASREARAPVASVHAASPGQAIAATLAAANLQANPNLTT